MPKREKGGKSGKGKKKGDDKAQGKAGRKKEDKKRGKKEDKSEDLAVGKKAACTANKPDHDRIAARAYELWLHRGRPEGEAERTWLEAERQLQAAP